MEWDWGEIGMMLGWGGIGMTLGWDGVGVGLGLDWDGMGLGWDGMGWDGMGMGIRAPLRVGSALHRRLPFRSGGGLLPLPPPLPGSGTRGGSCAAFLDGGRATGSSAGRAAAAAACRGWLRCFCGAHTAPRGPSGDGGGGRGGSEDGVEAAAAPLPSAPGLRASVSPPSQLCCPALRPPPPLPFRAVTQRRPAPRGDDGVRERPWGHRDSAWR